LARLFRHAKIQIHDCDDARRRDVCRSGKTRVGYQRTPLNGLRYFGSSLLSALIVFAVASTHIRAARASGLMGPHPDPNCKSPGSRQHRPLIVIATFALPLSNKGQHSNSGAQLDPLEVRGYLDPDRRGERADECDTIASFFRDCAVVAHQLRGAAYPALKRLRRQCQFPLYEASEIPLLLHRVLQPFLLAGASHARPTKRLEAQQICFSARRSWASDQRFANADPAVL
jgi:hypothetical protein